MKEKKKVSREDEKIPRRKKKNEGIQITITMKEKKPKEVLRFPTIAQHGGGAVALLVSFTRILFT